MKTCSRILVVFAATASVGSAAVAGTQAFLAKHCLDCHGAEEQKAGMRLDGLSQDFADPEVLQRWVGLFDRVAKREMPPRDAAQPPDTERDAFVATLRGQLIEADRRQVAEFGRRSVRRLNRTEYEHTLRDLLALPLLRVKELLPEDGQEFGFDKTAGALDISPVQMTKYLQASDVALRQAIVGEAKAPQTTVWREPAANQNTARSAIAIHCAVPLLGRELAPGLKTHIVGDPINDYGNSYRAATFQGEADSVALLTGVIGAHQPEGLQIDRFKPTISGWYRVRFSTWSLRWERTKAAPAVRGLSRNYTIFEPPAAKNAAGRWEYPRVKEEKPDAGRLENVEFYGETEATHVLRASLKGDVLGFFDAPSLQPKVHEFRVWLNPGERISFHPMTLPAVGARNSGVHEGVRSYEGPGVALDWFEVEGPLVEQWPPGESATIVRRGSDQYRRHAAQSRRSHAADDVRDARFSSPRRSRGDRNLCDDRRRSTRTRHELRRVAARRLQGPALLARLFVRRTRRRGGTRLRIGFAAVVLPVELVARRATVGSRPARRVEPPRDAACRSRTDAERSA